MEEQDIGESREEKEGDGKEGGLLLRDGDGKERERKEEWQGEVGMEGRSLPYQ